MPIAINTKGIAILHNNDKIRDPGQHIHRINGTIRSPSAKYFNAMAMLEETDHKPQCDVVNTAITKDKRIDRYINSHDVSNNKNFLRTCGRQTTTNARVTTALST